MSFISSSITCQSVKTLKKQSYLKDLEVSLGNNRLGYIFSTLEVFSLVASEAISVFSRDVIFLRGFPFAYTLPVLLQI